MMEGDSTTHSISKQKQHFFLVKQYKNALKLLNQEHTRSEGREEMEKLLACQFIDGVDVQELKFSVLMSLGEVSRMQANSTDAMYYFYQSTKIQESFNTWLKIADLLEAQSSTYAIREQIQIAYKHAVRLSPPLWKNRVMNKLLSIYEKHGKSIEVQDLRLVIAKNTPINYSIRSPKPEPMIEKENTFLPKIKIKVPLSQQNWDFILATLYFLLTNRFERNLCGKKQAKKNDKMLKEFSDVYDIDQTKIIFEFEQKSEGKIADEKQSGNQIEKQMEQNQMDKEQDEQEAENEQQQKEIDRENAKEIEKEQQIGGDNEMDIEEKQKEDEKQKDDEKQKEDNKKQFLEETINITPSIIEILKDAARAKMKKSTKQKKTQTTDSQKNKQYKCLEDYYRLQCGKGFKLDGLQILSLFDQTYNKTYYNTIIKPLVQYSKQHSSIDKENKDRALNKQPRLQQKPLEKEQKNKKQTNENEDFYKQDFVNYFDLVNEKQKSFPNAIIMGQVLIDHILDNLQEKKSLKASKWLTKGIIKIYERTNNFLCLQSAQAKLFVSELLIQHLQSIAEKDVSNSRQKAYHDQECITAKKFISENWSITDTVYQMTQKKKIKGLTLEEEQNYFISILKNLSICIKMNSIPNMRDEKKIQKHIKMYNYYQKLYSDLNTISEKVIFMDEKQLQQFVQKRLNKAKLKQSNTLAGESQEKALKAIDELLNADHEFAETAKSVCKWIMEETSISFCLKSFAKITNILFKKLSIDDCLFSSRLITSTFTSLKIPEIIDQIFKKLSKSKQKQLPDELSLEVFYYLIKIYLLGKLQNEPHNNAMRMIFFLINNNMQGLPESLKKAKYCQVVILLDELIKIKDSPELRKKFYQKILLKNIDYIYGIQCPTNQKLFNIFSEIYYKKDVFKAKRIEDAIGFFMMVNRENEEDLGKGQVEFVPKVKKVFNDCYNIYKNHFHELHTYCQKFNDFIKDFILVMKDKKAQSQKFIQICQGKEKICECCSQVKFLKEILFVIAKYLQTLAKEGKMKENEGQEKKSQGQLDEEEKYYMEYLALSIQQDQGWEEMVRLQSFKAYQHFDSYISPEPLTHLSYKFKYVKRIATFMSKHLTQKKQINLTSQTRIIILNTLKIKERKLNMVLARFQGSSEESPLSKKYFDGLSSLFTKYVKEREVEQQIEHKYFVFMEYMVPAFLNNLEINGEIANQKFGLRELTHEFRAIVEEINNMKEHYERPIGHLEDDMILGYFGMIAHIISICLGYLEYNIKSGEECSQNKRDGSTEKLKALDMINSELDTLFKWELLKVDMSSQNTEIHFKEKNQYIDDIDLLTAIQDKLYRLTLIFQQLSSAKIKSKKDAYKRNIILSALWQSKVYLSYGCQKKAAEIIKDCYSLKDQEIIHYYHHFDKQSTEKNLIVAEFYNRNIVYYIIKIEFFQHLILLFQKSKNLENFIILIRKIMKNYTFKSQQLEEQKQLKPNEQQIQKTEKQQKSKQHKEKQKKETKQSKEGKQGKQGKQVKEGHMNTQLKKNGEDKQKQKQKQKAETKTKEKVQKIVKIEKKNRVMFALFLKAYDTYLSVIEKIDKEVDEKSEKAILEFRNKLKKQTQKEKKTPSPELSIGQREYADRIYKKAEQFIQSYQVKYKKTIKMKVIKKKKEEMQKQNEGKEQKQDEQALQVHQVKEEIEMIKDENEGDELKKP